MQQKLEVEAVTQQQSLAVVKNMIRTSVRLLDNIDRKMSEICYLRNLFDEDCFCKKNYAGIMINALHPMDTKEGSEPHIHNSEAWQLTRWLEEGVFGEFHSSLCPYTSRCSRKALSSRSGLRDLRPSRGQIPIPPNRDLFLYSLPPLPKSLLDAFTYPDTQHIQLEVKQNNERSVVSTDGVKNQAVLLSSVFVPNPQVILLRTLITLCSTLSPLPRERWITLQLYYYDDITALLFSLSSLPLSPPITNPPISKTPPTPRSVPAIPPSFPTPSSSRRVVFAPYFSLSLSLQPFHAMCMKVRVTESTLQQTDPSSQHTAAETQEPAQPDADAVLRSILATDAVDAARLAVEFELKQPELDRLLGELGRFVSEW